MQQQLGGLDWAALPSMKGFRVRQCLAIPENLRLRVREQVGATVAAPGLR
jgi:hypothetical protein